MIIKTQILLMIMVITQYFATVLSLLQNPIDRARIPC